VYYVVFFLLNVDYKILNKVISNRLRSILTLIIHPHQTGFVPGRFIVDNALVVAALLEQLSKCDDATITLHDIEKAFDSHADVVQHEDISEWLPHQEDQAGNETRRSDVPDPFCPHHRAIPESGRKQ